MMDILEAYQELLHTIDISLLKQEITIALDKIKKDQELTKMLEEYHILPSIELEKKIYQNNNYQNFKRLETQTNLLILQINFKFKQLKQVVKDAHC